MTQLHNQVLHEGAHIGVYEIRSVISTDLTGITYSAWNRHLNALVTIKEYFPESCAVRNKDGQNVEAKSTQDQATYDFGLAKFLEQGEILTEILHHNVVSAHNVLQFNGTAYLSMDYENGSPLSELRQAADAYTEKELRDILTALLTALKNVHQYDSVHGDIHATNILIRENGQPVLINFAADRLAYAAHNNMLLQELRPGYAAAELYEADNRPKPAADIYALGATMYYCMTGKHPEPALERLAALNKNAADPQQAISDLAGSAYSEDFLKVIGWMLNPDDNERPQSVSEVLTGLNGDIEEALAAIKTPKYDDSELKINVANTTAQSRFSLVMSIAMGIAVIITGVFWYSQQHGKQTKTAVVTRTEKRPLVTVEKKLVDDKQVIAQADIKSLPPKLPVKQRETIDTTSAFQPENSAKIVTDADEKHTLQTNPLEQHSADEDNKPVLTQATAVTASTLQQEATSDTQKDGITDTGAKPAIETVPSSVTETVEDNNTLINRQLTAAEQAISEYRLTTPVEDNAYLHYQAVFKLDPENISAQQGLQRIVDRYVLLIERAIQDGQLARARRYLDRAGVVIAEDPDLLRLNEELALAKQ